MVSTRRCVSLHGSRANVSRTACSRVRLDSVRHAAVAGQRAAEDEEAVAHERVHEGGVLGPQRLLLQRSRAVELGARLAQHDEEHRHAGNVARSGAGVRCC